MSNPPGPSAEAIAYRSSYEPELDPIDFGQIEQVRADAKSGFAPAVDRAIARHQLELDDVVVGGVDCLRIRSSLGGTADGSMLYIFGGAFIVGDPVGSHRNIRRRPRATTVLRSTGRWSTPSRNDCC